MSTNFPLYTLRRTITRFAATVREWEFWPQRRALCLSRGDGGLHLILRFSQ